MFCPACKSEYRQGYTRCGECGVPLVEAAESPAAAPGLQRRPLAILWRGQDPVAFSAILGALADAAIPYRESQNRDYTACLSQPFSLSFYGLPHWQILVHPDDLEVAKQIVEDVLKPLPMGPVPIEAADGEEEAVTTDRGNSSGASSAATSSVSVPAPGMVCAWSSENAGEGELLRDALIESGVPCWAILRSSGEMRLLVRAVDESRASALIREARKRTA